MAPVLRNFLVVALVISLSHGSVAPAHHLFGGNHGSDHNSNVGSWTSEKVFRVGDNIWFRDTAALEGVAEVRSREEFDSCDVSNPIRMYTESLDALSLEGEGTRFFVSGNPESCKKGLKLHAHVLPQPETHPTMNVHALAAGPTIPSGSAPLRVAAALLWFGLGSGVALLCSAGF